MNHERDSRAENLQEIQRLGAKQVVSPPVSESGTIDTRVGKPPAFSGDANTWEDWSFKLRSSVSVVDLQLGIMMEEAELAAYANAWQPSVWVDHNMDAQLRYLLVMFTRGSAPQIIRKQLSASPPRLARSLAQLQELMHFDFGQEPVGVADRLTVFERLVGEYETSSGELLGVQVKCAVLLESSVGTQDTSDAHMWFSSRSCRHETDCGELFSSETLMAVTPANVNWRSTTGNRHRVWGKRPRQEEEGQGKVQGKAQRRAREQFEVRGLL